MTQQRIEPSVRDVADLYDALGPVLSAAWDDNFHAGYWEGPDDQSSVEVATNRFTDILIGKLGVTEGQRVLDVGCGIGKPAVRLARATGARVVGVSINETQVQQANDLAAEEGLAAEVVFQYADGVDLPFEDASFDAVLAFESIIHMDRPKALAEMTRVLVPGGRLVLTDQIAPTPEQLQVTAIGSLVDFETYPALVQEAGLLLEELLDVSENAKRTPRILAENIQKNAERLRPQAEGDRPAPTAALPTQEVAAEIGYLIMVARRSA